MREQRREKRARVRKRMTIQRPAWYTWSNSQKTNGEEYDGGPKTRGNIEKQKDKWFLLFLEFLKVVFEVLFLQILSGGSPTVFGIQLHSRLFLTLI